VQEALNLHISTDNTTSLGQNFRTFSIRQPGYIATQKTLINVGDQGSMATSHQPDYSVNAMQITNEELAPFRTGGLHGNPATGGHMGRN
ncbi:hypothetical protein GJ744_002914, partial [Endocarpon pusillum]